MAIAAGLATTAGPTAACCYKGPRHLSDKQWKRLKTLFATDDPTGQIQAAWAAKECLRQLLDALPASDGPLVVDPRRDPQEQEPALRPYEVLARHRHRRDVVASDRGLPAPAGHQRQNRGLQPQDQARRLRVPQPDQLRKAHHAQQRRDRGVTITVRAESRSTAKSPLTRLVARVRDAAMQRLWDTLSGLLTAQQARALALLLEVPEGARTSDRERPRRGPTRVSGKAKVTALDRAVKSPDSGCDTSPPG